MSNGIRIFFATDIHGSNICFRKFLNVGEHYGAQVLIMGGDVTGKTLVPIVQESMTTYRAHFMGENRILKTDNDLRAFEQRVGDVGAYTYRCNIDSHQEMYYNEQMRARVFAKLIQERVTQWVQFADQRLPAQNVRVYFNAGNDDLFSIDAIIDESTTLNRPEGKVTQLDGNLTMISTGYANVTPFRCPRDIPEDDLRERIDNMAKKVRDFSQCIFNIHCPPYNTMIDRAPKLTPDRRPKLTGFGVEQCSVGSTAVRDAIEEYQPLLGLHGHCHESRGTTRIGKTVCLNPGSEYQEGILRGVLVDLVDGTLRGYTFTSG